MNKQYKLVRCNINGKDVEQIVDVRASLTDMLRPRKSSGWSILNFTYKSSSC